MDSIIFPLRKNIKGNNVIITHSGVNKVCISLASLGEIKNLFVPCSFREGNNFFIFFHPCNNSLIKKVKKKWSILC